MAKKKGKSKLLRNLLIVVGGLLVFYFVGKSMGWFGKEKLTEVETAQAKKVDIVEKVTASGKIQPEVEVKISPDVSGEIVEVLVEEGDSVRKGQLLLRIRPDNFQDAVESAQASLNSVRANYSQAQAVLLQRKAELTRLKLEFDRSKDLHKQKVISDADFQAAQANYEVAQQNVEAAKQNVEAARFNMQSSNANLNQNIDNLSRTEIYAPMDGIVSQLNVENGEKVVGTAQMAGTEMLTIADLSNMEVQVDVNENDIIKVEQGQKVIIEVDSYINRGRKFEGIVTQIANTANATASADAVTEFAVKIRIQQSSYKDLIDPKSNRFPFRPGMTASVDIVTNEKKGVLSVPIAAVTTRNPENKKDETKSSKNNNSQKDDENKRKKEVREIVFVFDAETQKVRETEVKTGISDFENIEILEGLKAGDEIVTGPFIVISKQLKDEQKVKKQEQGNKSENKKE